MEDMPFIPPTRAGGGLGALIRLVMFPQVSGALTMTLPAYHWPRCTAGPPSTTGPLPSAGLVIGGTQPATAEKGVHGASTYTSAPSLSPCPKNRDTHTTCFPTPGQRGHPPFLAQRASPKNLPASWWGCPAPEFGLSLGAMGPQEDSGRDSPSLVFGFRKSLWLPQDRKGVGQSAGPGPEQGCSKRGGQTQEYPAGWGRTERSGTGRLLPDPCPRDAGPEHTKNH